MNISIGCDHGGFALKEQMKAHIEALGHTVVDCGCPNLDSCDYPTFGKAAAEAVSSGRCERGIVICTTGIGISIAANKIKGVRCALCTDPYQAEMTRRHNDANMLAIGAGIVGYSLAQQMVDIFLTTEFEGGRHARRVNLIEG